MKCPNCKTPVPTLEIDVCDRDVDGGVEVFFDCGQCGKWFVAIVEPISFVEFFPEQEAE